MTPHALAELPGSWSPALAPDGAHVAYVSDRDGSPEVWLQAVDSDHARRLDTGEHPVMSVAWSTDSDWLAVEIAPGGAPRHEVWLVRSDGTGLHQVAGFGTDTAMVGRWLPGRPQLAVTENTHRALLVDAVTGEVRTLFEDTLIALLDVSRDGQRILLRRGPRSDRHIAVRELRTGEEHLLVPGDSAFFGPDGHTVYARTDLGGEFTTLVRVRHGMVTMLAGRPDAGLDQVAVTPDGHTAALVWNVAGVSEIAVLDLRDGRHADVTPLPTPIADGCAWSADGRTLAFTAEGPDHPRGVWTAVDGKVEAVAAAGPVDAVAPELQVVTAQDGLTVTGWLYRPAGDGPYPAVIYLHGGPEAQERPGYNTLFQSLVRSGIAVFAPNVRGSAGFGRSFVTADNLAGRYAAIADVAACVEHLVSHGIADPGRVGCMGRSYGGYLTLAALVTYPELFAAGIDVCGMVNFATFYEHTEPWIAEAATSKYGHPITDAELLRDLSPITRIDQLRAPVLVVHGANDSNVPVCEAEQTVAALAERGVEHRLLLFPDEGHELLDPANRAVYRAEAVDWLCRHLGAGRRPTPA